MTTVKPPATSTRSRKASRALELGTKDTSCVPGSRHQTIREPRAEFSEDVWHEMVSTAAYFRAEARGFESGSTDGDWYEAEAELRERFSDVERKAEKGSNSDGDAVDIEAREK